MMDVDRMVEQRDSAYINGQKHMFATLFDEWQDDVDDDPEIFTVGIYDVNGKPFYIDVNDEGFAELNADENSPFKWVKPTQIIGNRMYKGDHLITLEETRKHA